MGSYLVLWSWHRIPLFFLRVQAFRFQLVHSGKLPIGMAWFFPLDDTGKISCQDSTESMPVYRTRAFRCKQCLFWFNFGYVVPEIKYAPNLVELISNNGYGMVMAYISWNQAERWRRKSSISTANTHPTARLCSPRAIRSRKERRQVSWTQTMCKSYFLAFLHTLDSRWLTSSPLPIVPQNSSPRINASLSSRSLECFQIFEIRQTLDAHGVWFSHG